jgi:hypothetical protein
LGARKTVSGLVELHAWLVVSEQVVTGGEFASYAPLGRLSASVDLS